MYDMLTGSVRLFYTCVIFPSCFPAKYVYIVGLVVLPDTHLEFGHSRFYELDLNLETRPRGALTPRVVETQTPLRPVEKWGDY